MNVILRFAGALACMAGFAVPVSAEEVSPAKTQIVVLGGEEALATRLPSTLPILTLDALPEAADARTKVFGALLRSNPVSTFVARPEADGVSFDQFFLIMDLTLDGTEGGFQFGIDGTAYGLEEFSTRLAAVVDAFQPSGRQIAFLRVQDTGDQFPVAMSDVQTVLDQLGFNMNVLMIEGAQTAEACGDTESVLQYGLLSGVADRTPFGNGDGVSDTAEVEAYLSSALGRLSTRGDGCGPDYSLIVKADEANAPRLISHGGLPAFTDIETRLYHETFEAMFLLESEDQGNVQSFLESCDYCPMEAALTTRLEDMRAYELSAKLEGEIWDRIRNDTEVTRLEIYLENCALCEFADDARTRISEIDIAAAATAEEGAIYRAAADARDLVALESYLNDCFACTDRDGAQALINEIKADTAYRAEREMLELAVERRDVAMLESYEKTCIVCDGLVEAKAGLAAAAEFTALAEPCLAAAAVPQLGGPRKLEEIDQDHAMGICRDVLARYPEDGLLITTMGRIAQAAGDFATAQDAYDVGVETSVPAAYGLAAYSLYAPADGTRPDYDAAEVLALNGAKAGDWLSKEILTVLYSKDLIPGKTAADAYRVALSMADEGNPLAQFFVGYFYQTGNGTEPSTAEAERWLSKSVEQGYLHAFSFLAELYEQGEGNPFPERAADLYWTALKEGDPTARDRLTVQLESRDQTVIRIIQEKLRDEGVYSGGIDGIAGPGTVAAITRFAETVSEAS